MAAETGRSRRRYAITQIGESAEMIPAASVSAPLRMRSSSVSSGRAPIAANRWMMPIIAGDSRSGIGVDAMGRPSHEHLSAS
jgi:hypothetical protein